MEVTEPHLNPERWLREQEQRFAQLRERAEETTAQLRDNVVEVTSRDRAVTVRVGNGGVLTDIGFSPRAASLSLVQLRAKIMETYRAASVQASERMTEIMSDLMGADSDAIAKLRGVLPRPENDDGPTGGERQ